MLAMTELDLRQIAQDLAFHLRPWLRDMLGDRARRIFSWLLAGWEQEPAREQAFACPWPSGYPLVSVVVPCFNYGRYLMQTLRSVRRQTLQAIELIVVDDGSDDLYTLRVLRRLERWAGINIMRQDNAGPGAARNAGISVALGRYICCLDADDLLAPDYLEKCAVVLEADAGTRLVHSWMQLFGSESRLAKTLDLKIDLLRFINHLGASAVFHREDWQAVNGYSTCREQHEDWDFWIRLASIGVRGRVIAEPLFFYRRHSVGRGRLVNGRGLHAYRELRREHPVFFASSGMRRRLKADYRQRVVADPFLNLGASAQYDCSAEVLCLHLRACADAQCCRDELAAILGEAPDLSLQVIVEHGEALPSWLQQRAQFIYRLPLLLEQTQWPGFVENFRRTRSVTAFISDVQA